MDSIQSTELIESNQHHQNTSKLHSDDGCHSKNLMAIYFTEMHKSKRKPKEKKTHVFQIFLTLRKIYKKSQKCKFPQNQ